jgi:hypothetical protein
MAFSAQESIVQTLIGGLRDDLQHLVFANDPSAAADMAKMRLADIIDMSNHSPAVSRAARHLTHAVDRVMQVKDEAHQTGVLIGEEQSSRAINLIEDPLAELSAAAHCLP